LSAISDCIQEPFPLSQVLTAHPKVATTTFSVLGAISFCHMLNDMLQALLPAVYPMLQRGFDLSFAQVGLLTFVYQVTASLLQPFIGLYTDRRPRPFDGTTSRGQGQADSWVRERIPDPDPTPATFKVCVVCVISRRARQAGR
jgi:MFS family permease